MSTEERDEINFRKFNTIRRKSVSLSAQSLVKTGYLREGEQFPLVIEPQFEEVNAVSWAESNRGYIEEQLLKHGAILFRGFKLDGVERFEEFARAVSPRLLDYKERSSPRSLISQGIYTSTDHPPDQYIHFHNEQSYTNSWPMKLWFFCDTPAERGGATPIADGRRVLSCLSEKLKERFIEKKVQYMRNYGDGIGLTWQTAFQTSDKLAVEDYCRRASISYEWKGGDRLRTRQIFDNIVTHPKTHEMVWFEHVAFFHISSVEPSIRQMLMEELREEDLPFNTYYGDGSTIADSVLEEVREAYRQVAISFSWQKRDLLLIDNVLTSHGRHPYGGPRKILVAMAELFSKHENRVL